MTLVRTKWPALWTAWIGIIILVGVLPLSNFVGHSHWEYIKWVPTEEQLRSPSIVLELIVDAVANILLFLPFGFCYARRTQEKPSSLFAVVTFALLLSCSIELYQVYCHNRNTSLLDILDNVVGAYLGFRVGARFFERSMPVERRDIAPLPSR
ncbi:MAG TPA: VanZ family protein [Nitrospiraceae bacterium]|nr:VanZ family protein [Nitrospiraceae bacterium]